MTFDNQEISNTPAKAGRKEWVGLSVLALACILYVMDLTVLHLAVPQMSADLNPSSVQLLWIIDIYGFLIAGSLITMGTLGDRIGRRRLLMIGAAAFGVASVLAAFSTSAEMLIASRALLGIAGATLGPSTLSLIFNMFRDPKQRSAAVGVWISAFSAGGAIGPVLGGVLLEYFWWGSVFLLALPVMALLLVLGPRVLPEFKNPNAGRLDLLSAAMSLVAVLSIIYGFKETAQDGFGLAPLGFILCGLVVGGLFARRQLTLADPLIDLRLFRRLSFNASLATNVIAVFIAIGYFLFVAQYLQLVLGLSPLKAGLWSLPSAVGFALASNLAPMFVHRFRPAYVLGFCFMLGAVGLLMLTQAGSGDSGLALVIAASVIVSLALSPVFALTTELIVGSAPPERAGAASGIAETCGELGGAMGIAILGSIGTSIYRSDLGSNIPSGIPAEAAAAARDTLGAATAVAGQLPSEIGNALLEAARNAFVHGMQVTSLIAAVVALVMGIVAIAVLRNFHPNSAASAETHIAELAVPAGISERNKI